jgi:hypothetical protein
MADRQTYLRLLSDLGFTEKHVLPILDFDDLKVLIQKRPSAAKFMLEVLLRGTIGKEQVARNFLKTMTLDTNTLVATMFDNLVRQLKVLGVKIPDGIFAGVLPLSTMNGATIKDADGSLLLIDNGTFLVVESATDTLLGGWPDRERPKRLAHLIKNYCNTPRRLPSTLDGLDAPIELAEAGLVYFTEAQLDTAAERFVIAHELGHIVLGHEGHAVARPPGEDSPLLVQSKTKIDDEFAADDWALEQLLSVARHSSSPTQEVALTYTGALIFLGIELLVEKQREVLGQLQSSHPPALERLERIRLNTFDDIFKNHGILGGDMFATLEGLKNLLLGGFAKYVDIGERFIRLTSECYKTMFGIPPKLKVTPMKDLRHGMPEPHSPRAYADQGRCLIISEPDGTISLLEAERSTLKTIRRVRVIGGRIDAIATSSTAIAAGMANGKVHVFDSFGTDTLEGVESSVTALCFPSSGKYVYIGDENGRLYSFILSPPQFRELRKKRPLLIPITGEAAHDCITGLAIDPLGKTLASSGLCDCTIRFWNIKNSTQIGDALSLGSDIWLLCWCSYGLVVADLDGVVKIWDPTTRAITAEIKLDSAINAMAISAEGKSIALATDSGYVVKWKVSGETLKIKANLEKKLVSIAIATNGSHIAVADAIGNHQLITV